MISSPGAVYCGMSGDICLRDGKLLQDNEKEPAMKKSIARKTAPKKIRPNASAKKKGGKYECVECGLLVTVDEPCGCVEACELVCCGQPMQFKR